MEQLEDMHEFEKDAKRKAYFIKEGKRKVSSEELIELLEKEGL